MWTATLSAKIYHLKSGYINIFNFETILKKHRAHGFESIKQIERVCFSNIGTLSIK